MLDWMHSVTLERYSLARYYGAKCVDDDGALGLGPLFRISRAGCKRTLNITITGSQSTQRDIFFTYLVIAIVSATHRLYLPRYLRPIMRAVNFVLALFAFSSTTVLCGKKKKGSTSMDSPKSHLATLKGFQCGLVAEIRQNFNVFETPFRKYCAFFSDDKRSVRADELPATLFISNFLCAMVPVMDELLSELSKVEAMCQRASSIERLHEVSQRSFPIAVDGQDFVNKIREAFPSLDSTCREIARMNVVTMKTRDLKTVFSTSLVTSWVRVTERQTSLNFEIGMLVDNFVTTAIPEDQSTTSIPEPALEEESDTSTAVPSDAIETTTTTAPTSTKRRFNAHLDECAAVDSECESQDEEVVDETSTTTEIPTTTRRRLNWADMDSDDDEPVIIFTTTTTTTTTTPRVNVWEQRRAARATTTTEAPTTASTAPRTSRARTTTTTQEPTTTEGGWVQVAKPKSPAKSPAKWPPKSTYPSRK